MPGSNNITNFLLVAFSFGFPYTLGDKCTQSFNICLTVLKKPKSVCLSAYRLCVLGNYGPGIDRPADLPVVIAVCKDDYVFAFENCSAGADIIEKFGGPNARVRSFQNPPGPYFLGDTQVTLTVTNGTDSASCQAIVTVVDNELPDFGGKLDCGGLEVIDRCSAPVSFTPTYTKFNGCPGVSVQVSSYSCSLCDQKFIPDGSGGTELRFKTKDMLALGWCNVSAESADTFVVHDTGGFGTFIAYNVEVCENSMSYCTEYTCTLCVDRPSSACRAELRKPGKGNIRKNTDGRQFQCPSDWFSCKAYECGDLMLPVSNYNCNVRMPL